MRAVFKYLVALAEAKFWGKLTLHFEGGRVVRAVKEESVKFTEKE